MRATYLIRNLLRNPLRTTLTAFAVALPITIYVLSTSVVDGIEAFLDNSARQLRLAITHKASIVNPLPAGYRAKIESLDPTGTRILAVCSMRFIGGRAPNSQLPLSTLAADHDTFSDTFPEFQLTPQEQQAWISDRQALIAGSSTAVQLGWEVGRRATLTPSLPPYSAMEFHVVATSARGKDPITNWCRRDYLEAELRAYGAEEELVSFIFVKCASKADLDYFRLAIDQLFAHSPDETRTLDEKAFMNEFVTQQFNLPRNLTILGAVTVFVAIMAAANTMSMNFRDRLNEYATLKALGFSRSLVFVVIQTESLFVCLAGGIAGALAPYVAFTHTPLANKALPLIQKLNVAPAVCAKALVISLVVGLLAGIWPAWLAARLKVVNALRALG